MANSLGRDIKETEIVVLDGLRFSGDINARAFRCLAGFGLHADIGGKAVYGHLVSNEPFDGESAAIAACFRAEGYEISKPDTEKYQREHGNGVTGSKTPYLKGDAERFAAESGTVNSGV